MNTPSKHIVTLNLIYLILIPSSLYNLYETEQRWSIQFQEHNTNSKNTMQSLYQNPAAINTEIVFRARHCSRSLAIQGSPPPLLWLDCAESLQPDGPRPARQLPVASQHDPTQAFQLEFVELADPPRAHEQAGDREPGYKSSAWKRGTNNAIIFHIFSKYFFSCKKNLIITFDYKYAFTYSIFFLII